MNLNKDNVLSYIRKESLDIYNRLHSIEEDISFVNQVYEAYRDAPLLPNLRCGAWYTDPKIATVLPAYFKSTDGHFNNWSFNLRRSNLHLLQLLAEKECMILVDSTRSGKRIPDALSKTVPIWCAVINRASLVRFPELVETEKIIWDTDFYTPPAAVSTQEHHQIEQRLDDWANSLAKSSFELPRLPRPLRPVWITPASTTFPELPTSPSTIGEFLPVICVSASKKVDEGLERRLGGYTYVQGSGDDHELWGMGLTPAMFWEHRQDLLKADRLDLPDLVKALVSQQPALLLCERKFPCPTLIQKVHGRLQLCSTLELADMPMEELGITKYLLLTCATPAESTASQRHIHVTPGKKGKSHFLTRVLPESIDFIQKQLYGGYDTLIACDTGKDLSVGVALAALQLFFRDDGSLKLSEHSDGHTASVHDLSGSSPAGHKRTRLEPH
ncbi:tRNA A64-2'-O-ribosylphosphate transferase [Crepidotus variabilis]|uniref:tRNA A64-2'-O-ribosylphosphate transferase n=1 Tax=Crepidotus variabilis TaxID=179855 RepID=A0A9P6JLG5_9AGAR|nr:tRNA A64-2'-O-ribosylphosphate transferase [Crepidotus variabilis]